MKAKKLKQLKRGEWFTLKEIEEPLPNQVWIRGPYEREFKKYGAYCWNDVNKFRLLKGETAVYTDFIF